MIKVKDMAGWETLSIGSDESGKGDFFGGPVVVAVRLDEETLEKLKNWKEYHKIQDSKKCSDEWIRRYALDLMNMCRHEVLEFAPPEYNSEYERYMNMNALLAHMHNDVHSRLEGEEIRIMDAFTNMEGYRRHLRDNSTPYKGIDIMEQKAESKYLSVALASIIARYLYMKQMDALKRESGVIIPYGNSYATGMSVVDAYRDLMDTGKYSIDELNRKFVKMNFSTLEKIKGKLGIR